MSKEYGMLVVTRTLLPLLYSSALLLTLATGSTNALLADIVFKACQNIERSISSASSVYWPGSGLPYAKDISHYASSSSALATCSVEPGTAVDVGKILRILGSTRAPFAVKGGGHAMNPDFSSTTGVQIAMYRFNEVMYDPDTNTAEVGAGLVWDEVFAALQPHGVSAVGGRAPGIGVAGFTLGGGYSWKTNQHGLAIDNVVRFELVRPNGEITSVTQDLQSSLFWALKGGFNNFGIVTKFTFKTYPQPEVWGGTITYIEDFSAVNNAIVTFTNTVTDPKAVILASYAFTAGQMVFSLLLFYDGPTPPPDIFDDLMAIPSITQDIKTRALMELLESLPTNTTGRGVYNAVSHFEYTAEVMNSVQNETQFWGRYLAAANITLISYSMEPFLPSMFSHAPEGSSAYPPSRAHALFPLSIYIDYNETSADEMIYDAIRQSAAQLTRVAISEGQDLTHASLYGNYAIFSTSLEKIYGRNLEKLKELKSKYDPDDVMGLAGGWKF